MILNIDEQDLRNGVLGLVVALVEVIKETLRHQAVRRMEGGTLTDTEIEKLGEALMALDAVIEKIKADLGITEAVKAVRDSLDQAVQGLLDSMLAPIPAGARLAESLTNYYNQ